MNVVSVRYSIISPKCSIGRGPSDRNNHWRRRRKRRPGLIDDAISASTRPSSLFSSLDPAKTCQFCHETGSLNTLPELNDCQLKLTFLDFPGVLAYSDQVYCQVVQAKSNSPSFQAFFDASCPQNGRYLAEIWGVPSLDRSKNEKELARIICLGDEIHSYYTDI
jgi:hypothetical protein